MKVKDIITRVRNIAGDNDAIQFSDGVLLSWINEAQRECAATNLLLQKKGSVVVTNGVKAYPVPNDVLKLHSISYNDEPLATYTLDEIKDRGYFGSAVGTPQVCYIWAGNIELYPTPDNSVDTLQIYYSRLPTEVEGEQDVPDLPVSYHQRLVDYCLAQVAQQDDDSNKYELKMQEFRTGVQVLKDLPEWNNDVYPSITTTGHDFGNGYLFNEQY